MIQHRRVTGEGEIRLGLQRLRREFRDSPGTASARRDDAVALREHAARNCAGIEKQTNHDQNR